MESHVLTNIKKMNCQNAEDVKRVVKELNVSFIQFWFPDVLGFLKSFAERRPMNPALELWVWTT